MMQTERWILKKIFLMIEIQSTITEMNVFGGLISRLDIARERINEIKDGLIQPRGVRWGGR